MRITEILTEDQLDEVTAGQVGQGIGKVAGNVVRGTKDFFSGIKTGYQQGKTGQPAQPQPSDSTAPTAGTSAAPAGSGASGGGAASSGFAPSSSGSGSTAKFSSGPTAMSAGDSLDPDSLENIKSLVAKLNPTQKQEIAKAIEQGAGSGSSAPAQGSAPDAGAKAFGQMASQLTPPSTSSTGGTTTQTPTGVKHTANPNNPNQPKAASAASNATPDTSGSGAMRQFMNTVTPDQPSASGAQTSPDATPPADAAKLTKQQQDAKKAELLGRRQAGASMATQTGGGFQNYVAGSGERMTGVDDQGAPVFKKIQREATFKSKFLEMDI